VGIVVEHVKQFSGFKAVIRSALNREQLTCGLAEGHLERIHFVASDCWVGDVEAKSGSLIQKCH